MICWYCHHPINTQNMTLRPDCYGLLVGKSTYHEIGEVPASIYDTQCRHCGAVFHVEITLASPPRLAEEQLKVHTNGPQHP